MDVNNININQCNSSNRNVRAKKTQAANNSNGGINYNKINHPNELLGRSLVNFCGSKLQNNTSLIIKAKEMGLLSDDDIKTLSTDDLNSKLQILLLAGDDVEKDTVAPLFNSTDSTNIKFLNALFDIVPLKDGAEFYMSEAFVQCLDLTVNNADDKKGIIDKKLQILGQLSENENVDTETVIAVVSAVSEENFEFISEIIADEAINSDGLSELEDALFDELSLQKNTVEDIYSKRYELYNSLKDSGKLPSNAILPLVFEIDKDNPEINQDKISSTIEFADWAEQNGYLQGEGELAGAVYWLSPHNTDFIKTMLKESELPNIEIFRCAQTYKASNPEEILNARLDFYRNQKDNPNLSSDDFLEILKAVNHKNTPFVLELISDSDFPKDKITRAIRPDYNLQDTFSALDEKKKVYDHLKNDTTVSKDELASILSYMNNDNKEFACRLALDENFPKDKIAYTILAWDEDGRKEKFEALDRVYTAILEAKNFKADEIPPVLQEIDSATEPLALALISDSSIPRNTMQYALRDFTPTNDKEADKINKAKFYNARLEVFNLLKQRQDIKGTEIVGILQSVIPEKLELAKAIVPDTSFDSPHIKEALGSSYSAKNDVEASNAKNEIIKFLKDYPDMDKKVSSEIVVQTTTENLELAKKLIEDEAFPDKAIADSIRGSSYGEKTKDIEAKLEFYNFVSENKEKGVPVDSKSYGIIMPHVTAGNLNLVKDYFFSDKIDVYNLNNILWEVRTGDLTLPKLLIEDTNFPKSEISHAVSVDYSDNEKKSLILEKRVEFYNQYKNIEPKALANILSNLTLENYNLAELIANHPNFNYSCIPGCLYLGRESDESKIALADKKIEFLNEFYDINPNVLGFTLSAINLENYDFACDIAEKPIIPLQEVCKILSTGSTQNGVEDMKARHEIFNTLKNQDIKENLLLNFLKTAKSYNKELMKTLISDGKFSLDNIPSIIPYSPEHLSEDETRYLETSKSRLSIYNSLKNNPNIDIEEFRSLLCATIPENHDLILTLSKDSDFEISDIISAVYITSSDNRDVEKTIKCRLDIYNKFKDNPDIEKSDLAGIMQGTNPITFDIINDFYANCSLDNKEFSSLLYLITPENADVARTLISKADKIGLNVGKICSILMNSISSDEVEKLTEKIGVDRVREIPDDEIITLVKFVDAYKKDNLNEISQIGKRQILKWLVSTNTNTFDLSEETRKDFPLLPRNQEEYCTILPALVKSLGIETKPLDNQAVEQFNEKLFDLSDTIASVSDEEFNSLTFTQQYDKEKFITDVLGKISGLSENEQQKVFDYFGFELNKNIHAKIGYSISGYPMNLNNGKKLEEISDTETRKVIESLRENVIDFSENNKVECQNKELEKAINELIEFLPELRPEIGKSQSSAKTAKKGSHDFDVFKHSLKVMQRVSQNSDFKKLNDSDKKILLLASLLHDISKKEGMSYKSHPQEGSFDSFFITKKFNLSQDEQIKLYTLILNHEWLGDVNSAKNEDFLTNRLKSYAYNLRHDNLFDMSLILTHADLMGVRADDSFHNVKRGNDIHGNARSFGEAADYYAGKTEDDINSNTIRGYINELKKSQPLLPVTKFPTADRIEEAITTVNPDGSTNIKGVYKDTDGLVILKYNEIEDWEAIGFEKGSTSRGIQTVSAANEKEEIDTGNIKFFVHGLDYENQLVKFDAFSLVDSDSLLSVSYAERPESKYRFFRPQGVILNADTKFIHGGGETDAGSGYGKNIQGFKDRYIFGGERQKDRDYISNLIKETTGMDDNEYIDFVKKFENKPFSEIEPPETREKIIKAFSQINSSQRLGNRSYNEMYISNPKPPMGVFAYNPNVDGKINNPVEFLRSETECNDTKKSISEATSFLREYAKSHNVPFVVFGD